MHKSSQWCIVTDVPDLSFFSFFKSKLSVDTQLLFPNVEIALRAIKSGFLTLKASETSLK